jgi:hypothetical protein
MKPRLLIRALCVGAALLVPVGGLAVLGVGTAGANTTIQFVSVSKANLGTVGTATLVGILCTVTTATKGTKQCKVILTKTAKTAQIPIKVNGVVVLHLLLTTINALVTVTPAGTIKKINFKAATIATIQIKSTTTPALNNCLIRGMPGILFVKTTSTKFKAVTVAIGAPTVAGCTGGSTENAKVAELLETGKLSGTITT